MLSHDLASPALSAELAAGERILWSGLPDPLISMVGKGGSALFAVPWLMITGSALAAATARGETIEMLVGVAFVCVGVFLLVRPILEYRGARGTTYAITDRRLIIVSKNGRSTKSIQLSGISQVERATKRGRITLRIPTALTGDGDGGQKVGYTDLHGIEDGERAYRLLTQRRS